MKRYSAFSKAMESGANALLSERRWAATYFGRACWSVYVSGRMCPGSSGNWPRCSLTRILESQRTVSLGTNPPWRGYVYRLALEALLLGRMSTGPVAFFEPPGVSRLRPCTRPHLKKKGLVSYSSGWWDIRQIPTSSEQSNLTVSDGHFYLLY